jgi:hypothetical protein
MSAETVTAADTGIREHDVIAALESRYAKVMQTGRRYITAPQVRNAAGFDATRTFDYVAIDTWTSGHLAVHIFEIKVARSDWLRELKQPQKTAEALRHADYFWIAATPGVVKVDELPDRWGLIEVRPENRTPLHTQRAAKRLTPRPSRPGYDTDESGALVRRGRGHAPLDRDASR